MLKVLQIYYEPQPSGQTAHVLSLVRGLDPRRYEVTVVLPECLAACAADFQRASSRVVLLPLRKLVWQPETIATIIRLIRRERFEIVHIHSQEAGVIARPVARIAGATAVVYTPQTIDIRRRGWQPLYIFLERILARFTERIVSVNDADRARLIRWGIPAAHVVTVPNGVDLSEFSGPVDIAELRHSLGLDAGVSTGSAGTRRPLVMQVGRLSAQKDPLTFVAGAALVVQACPDAQLALIGDGPLRPEVTARIEALGLQRSVRLLGWQSGAARLMAAADVVTLTSRWEGLPYALLEAMGWSRPVVATAVNGCPEVVAHGVTGFLAPPGAPNAWAGQVIHLLRNPEQAKAMGREGRRRAEERFDLKQMHRRIKALYSDLASDSP
jgi:glycosyltransferase involved in cell wall biosynthesis